MIDLKTVESVVATQVEYRITNMLREKYPNINVTTDVSDKPASFPNICLYEENSQETANNLNNQTINALNSFFHVVVTSNTSRADAKYIRNCVMDIMKYLRYTERSSNYVKSNNLHIYNLHFKRTICSGDEF